MPSPQQMLLFPVGARQDDLIKGTCSPGILGPNPGRIQLDSAGLMLHSYPIFDLSNVTKRQIFFDICQ